jgi:hypothetical protein
MVPMLREILFTAALLCVEALVVAHWFLFPHDPYLQGLALGAGAVMALMAALDVVLLVGVLQRDPARPQERRELEDLAHVEPLWAGVTVLQLAFVGAAWVAGVYWLVAVLVAGQGAELVAVATARLRTRRPVAGRPGLA